MSDSAERMESAVLLRVLEVQPTRFTVEELSRDIGGEQAGPGIRAEVEKAIGGLVKAELLHASDEGFVTPTRAAVRLGELFRPVV